MWVCSDIELCWSTLGLYIPLPANLRWLRFYDSMRTACRCSFQHQGVHCDTFEILTSHCVSCYPHVQQQSDSFSISTYNTLCEDNDLSGVTYCWDSLHSNSFDVSCMKRRTIHHLRVDKVCTALQIAWFWWQYGFLHVFELIGHWSCSHCWVYSIITSKVH